ncbi:MAG: hypothetical protein HQ517_08550, partial [SAR324 cluster bacterium]|nr:hypothetical protein [SAR324 cluster bacterium]
MVCRVSVIGSTQEGYVAVLALCGRGISVADNRLVGIVCQEEAAIAAEAFDGGVGVDSQSTDEDRAVH